MPDPNIDLYDPITKTFDHATMMAEPHRWLRYPVLPVKRYRSDSCPKGWPDMGIMICSVPNEVFKLNLLDLATDNLFEFAMILQEARNHNLVYADQAALLADGWIVD